MPAVAGVLKGELNPEDRKNGRQKRGLAPCGQGGGTEMRSAVGRRVGKVGLGR